MRYFSSLFLLFLLISACREKKTSLADEDSVEAREFLEFFDEISLPIHIADTSLLRKDTSNSVGFKVLTRFVPDSMLAKDFGKAQPKIYGLGKTLDANDNHYVFVKAINGSKRTAYLICFDEDFQYKGMLTLVSTGFHNSTSAYGMVDAKHIITTYRERKRAEDLSFKRNVYKYNSETGDFTLILTEPNTEMIDTVINPIATLDKTHKLSGDYIKDDRNLISVRDGVAPGELLFYVHFERNTDDCRGELKGVMRLTGENSGIYKEVGNPCTLQFEFSKTGVEMKEIEGCGAHRDIICFFEGKFPRKEK